MVLYSACRAAAITSTSSALAAAPGCRLHASLAERPSVRFSRLVGLVATELRARTVSSSRFSSVVSSRSGSDFRSVVRREATIVLRHEAAPV